MTPQHLQLIALIAVALNVVQFPLQAYSIFRKKSGEAISAAWFASSIGIESVNIVFGNSQNTLIFVANAWVCIAGQSLILFALGKYKSFGRKEKIMIGAMLATIAAAILIPFKAWVQMGATLLNLYGGKDQPAELDRSPGTGALSFWSLLMSGLSALLWVAYCRYAYGFKGPIWGYALYSGYVIFMIAKWLWKSRSATSS